MGDIGFYERLGITEQEYQDQEVRVGFSAGSAVRRAEARGVDDVAIIDAIDMLNRSDVTDAEAVGRLTSAVVRALIRGVPSATVIAVLDAMCGCES